ncbi:MAG: hypothetical protein BWY38_01644 [Ignavibacteria bacterium ADurb.Bin266]|nr:MAG: hypothetical protein BWY38_01644 [Ignavibacteria bacterium ADurb.Bin266]
MINQYPHYLFIVSGGESSQDENGNWNDSSVTSTLLSICREETNGRGTMIQVAGGTFYTFSSLIQLPRDCPKVEEGTSIFVADNKDGSGIRVKGTVLKFDKGQLHNRIWV